ncbi:MAG: hypothetical protein J6Z11_11810 [Candidatus Riflebacteria bacterium]|nr:hypothetical protein [Candidatus Riflebacteria bacterium]
MTGNSALPYIGSLVLCGSVGLFILVFRHIRRNSILWAILTILFITGSYNYLIIKSISLGDIVSNILYFGVIVVMFTYPLTYKQSFFTYYIIISIFLFGFFRGIKTHEVLTSSGNYISVIMILSASLYYITIQYTNRNLGLIDFVPSLLSFLLSVWARGRGGIICSALLLLLMTIYYLRNFLKKDAKRYFFVGLLVFSIIFCFILYEINPINAFMGLGKLSSRGLDNGPREKIWKAYFEKIENNIEYLFIGVPIQDVPVIHDIGDNTHNSFLHLHATNGIFSFVLFLLLIIKAMIYHLRTKKILFAIMLLVIFARGMSDKFIFGQYGMPILLYLVLYPYFSAYISCKVVKIKN